MSRPTSSQVLILPALTFFFVQGMVIRLPANHFDAWEPSSLRISFDNLPPLPPITDPDLRTLAFTHKTYVLESNRFKDYVPLLNERSCYKVLEFQGDAALHHLLVRILIDCYPDIITSALSVSTSDLFKSISSEILADACFFLISQHLRELLTNNITLSHLARHYNLADRFLLSKLALKSGLHESQSVHADVFEAYIGALEREIGGQRLESWLRQVFRPEVFPELGEKVAAREEKLAAGEAKAYHQREVDMARGAEGGGEGRRRVKRRA